MSYSIQEAWLLPRMGGASCLLLHIASLVAFSEGVARASSSPGQLEIAQSDRQPQVSLRGLWDKLVHPTSKDIDSVRIAEGARRKRGAQVSSERVSLAAGGALMRSEKEEPEEFQAMPGSAVQLFMRRDGLEAKTNALFDGAAELSKRLQELRQKCPGALGEGWMLTDAGQDNEGGHHWALRGPSSGSGQAASVFLHVSSAPSRQPSESHSALVFSPAELCRMLPAAMIDGVKASATTPYEHETGAANTVTLSQPEVVASLEHLVNLVRQETHTQCNSANEIVQLNGTTALSAEAEVADPLLVKILVRMTSEGGQTTYHKFFVDWHMFGGSAVIEKVRPVYDASIHADLGWCELFTKSTETHLGILAEREGAGAPEALLKKLGLLEGYRNIRPDPNVLFEKAGTRSADTSFCLESPVHSDTYSVRADNPQCMLPADIDEQGECSAGFVFATTQALAVRACIKWGGAMMKGDGRRKSFSKQMIMSCNNNMFGCAGGSLGAAYEEARKGIALEDDYPYHPGFSEEFPWSGFGKQCQWGNVAKPFVVTAHYAMQDQVQHNQELLQKEIFCNGPVAAGFKVMSDFWNFMAIDATRVYKKENAEAAGFLGYHATVITGWGTKDNCHTIQVPTDCGKAGSWSANKCAYRQEAEEGKRCEASIATNFQYWECANSWGEGWGDHGFFKMERGVNACLIESVTVHAGEVKPTMGSWLYKNWGTCNAGTQKKTRELECAAHTFGSMGCSVSDVGCISVQTQDTCPKLPITHAQWPDPALFPAEQSYWTGEAGKYQELAATKSCTNSPTECSGKQGGFTFCNGKGTASMSIPTATSPTATCGCQCYDFYSGDSCESCSADASGWPRCRELCTADDCSNIGTASGNKWLTEFGMPRNSCECVCGPGFAGAKCEQCANPVTHTYPHCHGSIAYIPWQDRIGIHPGDPTTSTAPPPPTHFYRGAQCNKNSKPIELMPPAGPHWLVLDCDVRKDDCSPDMYKCLKGVYAQYCSWDTANLTEFPCDYDNTTNSFVRDGSCGQCVYAGNETSNHVKMEGTDRMGENMTNAENKTGLSAHRSSGVNTSDTNNSSDNSTNMADIPSITAGQTPGDIPSITAGQTPGDNGFGAPQPEDAR